MLQKGPANQCWQNLIYSADRAGSDPLAALRI